MRDKDLFGSRPGEVSNELEALEPALAAVERRVLDRDDVVGVGLGHRVVAGRQTHEPCVIVLVSRRLPAQSAALRQRIASAVAGVPIDVLAVGRVVAEVARSEGDMLGADTPGVLTRRMRPVRPGFSVGHPATTAGTIGAVCRDASPGSGREHRRYVLGTAHVLAGADMARRGDPICQPGPLDGGGPGDVLGRLDRFVPIRFDDEGDEEVPASNVVDAAVAEVDADEVDPGTYWAGAPSALAGPAVIGSEVKKTGRTSLFTTGRVLVLRATVRVDYGRGRRAMFRDQIVTTAMSAPGDSGSLVLDTRNRPVGMLFAGSREVSVCNPIASVQIALGVRLCL